MSGQHIVSAGQRHMYVALTTVRGCAPVDGYSFTLLNLDPTHKSATHPMKCASSPALMGAGTTVNGFMSPRRHTSAALSFFIQLVGCSLNVRWCTSYLTAIEALRCSIHRCSLPPISLPLTFGRDLSRHLVCM